jgi:predicted chitinase
MLDNQKKIANKVYANRMGNGDEKGEPSKFIGRGALQLTGINCFQISLVKIVLKSRFGCN